MISQVGCDMKAIDKRLVQLETGDGGDPISLNTIHKAKGLEADRVWFLGPSFLPSPWAKAAWELAQERNLAYVAVTRARSELIKIEPGPLAENMLQAMDRRRKAATKNAA
jgi:superfamily I DNA/RNA helicase